MKWKPYKYQKFSINHAIKNLFCGLFLDMGLGKTVITLTVIKILIYEYLEISKVIVIAPLRVAENVWTDEIAKWDHLKKLRVSKVLGTERQRIRALNAEADIYIINRENVAWLVRYYSRYRWPFEMAVVDELSSFKSNSSERFKAFKKVRPHLDRFIGNTGTPAPNSLMDLWSQMFMIDEGERLGKTITYYRDTYFSCNRQENYSEYKLIPGADKLIHKEISDVCISMDAKDYIELPEFLEHNIVIDLPSKVLKQYKEFEKEQFIEVINNDIYGEITAMNAAVLANKLAQFASGQVYDENKSTHIIHSYKLDELGEMIEALSGNPLLIFYGYKSSQSRICKRFKGMNPLKTKRDIDKWNAGDSKYALVHPASAGHGLNLQFGGHHALWFDNTWSVELKLQANKRLHRPGQSKTVLSYNLVCRDTIDEEIMKRQGEKISTQSLLLQAIKARIKKYKNF